MKFNASETLAEKIAKHLEDRIVRMEIKQGERLVEAKIADELGVSQSSVREALRILEKIRFVKLMPRHGTHVTEITEDYIISVYDIFKELVGLATRKTAERRKESDIALIVKAQDIVENSLKNDDPYPYNEAFFNWGVTCLKAAEDPLLEEMLVDLVPTIRRFHYMSLLYRRSNEMADTVVKMKYSTECIINRKVEEAARNNMDYLEGEKSTVLKIFKEYFTGSEGQSD